MKFCFIALCSSVFGKVRELVGEIKYPFSFRPHDYFLNSTDPASNGNNQDVTDIGNMCNETSPFNGEKQSVQHKISDKSHAT